MNMKLNTVALPLMLALAAMLATTGCRHGFNGKVTNLPGQRGGGVGGDASGGNTLAPGTAFDNTPPPVSTPSAPVTPGTTPTADINLDNYNQDRAALAAYTVHFKFDSAVVQDSEQANLASVAQALSDQSLK